jgi:SpoVK/Ycf46/Vps4 family AAA+-type ATPase
VVLGRIDLFDVPFFIYLSKVMTDQIITQAGNPYKFKELKVYGSTEYLADNHKKYRQVFDRQHAAYIYAELSLYNKLFDQADWRLEVELKCFLVKRQKKQEVCKLELQKEISRYDNIVYIREGWGNQQAGIFWKRGTYFWEAYVNGEKVGSKYFYVIEAEEDDELLPNPYLELQSVRLYEGPYDDVNEDDRVYYRKFNKEETRYIYVELILRNLQPSRPWHLELFTKFYNQARELKGQVIRLLQVNRNQETIRLTAGWGATTQGLWCEDDYLADVIFMDKLLVSIPFSVQREFEPGVPLVYLPGELRPRTLAPSETDNETFEDIMQHLDALIGLPEIKQQVRDHAVYLRYLQLRKSRGVNEAGSLNVHSVFMGNPGTGKTTVAKMMGRLYRKMGLLSKGHVHSVDRVDLVGEYIGQTAPKTREAIEKARGGVLFIDEAYALARGNDDGKDFGREVIEILVKEMSDGPGDLAVIVAGYPKEMETFLASNPGLRSRFKHQYEFRDYLPQELSAIADYAATQKQVSLTAGAKARIDELIIEAYRNRDRTFGNARFVFDLLEKAKIQMALRLMQREDVRKLDPETLGRIQAADIDRIKGTQRHRRPKIPVDEIELNEALAELDSLIGMEHVKAQVRELVHLVRFYHKVGRDVLNSFYLHSVLVGNPGTGKTTIARILARLFKALGILERGHLVETDRQGLVAGYVGQTAIKTAAKIDEAIGGVLFIDEAYALTQSRGGQAGDFGDEAIQTLLKRMEDQRGKFFVFVAGYPANMDSFLRANPGLNSRFDQYLRFEDFSPAELLAISQLMFAESQLQLTEAAAAKLERYLQFIHQYRDAYFGNARTVRNIVQEIIRQQHLRLAQQEEPRDVESITLADLEHLTFDTADLRFDRKRIGFS